MKRKNEPHPGRRRSRQSRMSPSGTACLSLSSALSQKAERRSDEVRGARHRVAGAEIPRFADEARVNDAELVVDRAHVAKALLLVRRIAVERPLRSLVMVSSCAVSNPSGAPDETRAPLA